MGGKIVYLKVSQLNQIERSFHCFIIWPCCYWVIISVAIKKKNKQGKWQDDLFSNSLLLNLLCFHMMPYLEAALVHLPNPHVLFDVPSFVFIDIYI